MNFFILSIKRNAVLSTYCLKAVIGTIRNTTLVFPVYILLRQWIFYPLFSIPRSRVKILDKKKKLILSSHFVVAHFKG